MSVDIEHLKLNCDFKSSSEAFQRLIYKYSYREKKIALSVFWKKTLQKFTLS